MLKIFHRLVEPGYPPSEGEIIVFTGLVWYVSGWSGLQTSGAEPFALITSLTRRRLLYFVVGPVS